MDNKLIPMDELSRMAHAVAKSGLFGIRTVEEAISLMLIAQAEGLHPGIVARDYHIINGRPALKADAMMARYQAAGGKVAFTDYTDERVTATFSHPAGGEITVTWDLERAKKAQLGGNGMWKKFPRQMLRSRVVSEGIRATFPGCVVGVYTPEEVCDFEDVEKTPAKAPKKATPAKDTHKTEKASQEPSKREETAPVEEAVIVQTTEKPVPTESAKPTAAEFARLIAEARKAIIDAGLKSRQECFDLVSNACGREVMEWSQCSPDELHRVIEYTKETM